jgi:hypothetical protein
MQKLLRILGSLAICIVAQGGFAQTQLPVSSLCDLQAQTSEGEHRSVRVQGIFLAGIEGDYFIQAGCSEHTTYVELRIEDHRSVEKLTQLDSRPFKGTRRIGYPVLVTFDGEFYGARARDPQLPGYRAGWDPHGISMTKLVAFSIESVDPLPPHHPCAAPKSNPTDTPCFQHPSTPYRN